MRIQIDRSVFDKFREYSRAVIVAQGVDNRGDGASLESELEQCVADVRRSPDFEDYKSHPRVKPWVEAFWQLNMNPNRTPPGIAGLVKRVRSGGKIPLINTLVALMNICSLRHGVPAGGDDLAATSGFLVLGPARGNERYTPLGKPETVENPDPGEWIYYDAHRGEVLCRGWCWRNSHTTRILPGTNTLAGNVDGLPPVGPEEVEAIARDLASEIHKHCGGHQQLFLLTPKCPVAEFELQGPRGQV